MVVLMVWRWLVVAFVEISVAKTAYNKEEEEQQQQQQQSLMVSHKISVGRAKGYTYMTAMPPRRMSVLCLVDPPYLKVKLNANNNNKRLTD